MQSHNYKDLINRFVAACQADERVIVATLFGSHVTGTADAYSDLDLGLITTDKAYEDFVAGCKAFIRQLGEPVFLENFYKHLIFFIFPDGTEGHLSIGCESKLNDPHGGLYKVLLDKKNILEGAVFPRQNPTQAEQRETLRSLINWFWHDLSHFIAALGRGQLWWAYGQLEELRRYCVNLARLRHNFSASAGGLPGFPYEKVEEALPAEHLSPLQATCCPLEPDAMLQAAFVIVRFYRELAPVLARVHDLSYPADLDHVMSERLEELCDARLI